MAKYYFLIIFACTCQISMAQIAFTYDDAGNRVKRVSAPDLTPAQFFSNSQLAVGAIVNYVVAISNVGSAATSNVIEFSITNYTAVTGLTMTLNPASSVTIDGDVFTLDNNDFTVTTGSSRFLFESKVSPNVSIPSGGVKFIGFILTRTGGSAGTVNNTVTIVNGTGGGETPYPNNTIANTIRKL